MSGALRGVLATVLGAGIIIGASGVAIIIKIIQERKKKTLNDDLNSLDLTVAEPQEELTALISNSLLSSSRLSLRSNSSRSSRFKRNGSYTEDEMYSAIGSDVEEFYDISDDEDFSQRSSRNSFKNANDENAINLFEEIDILFKGNDEDRLNALTLLKQEENQYSENPSFLWRMAKAYQMQATSFGARNDKDKKKECVFKGLEYAGRALAADPLNPDAHKWYAILIGMQGEYLSVKEKIQNGFTFQNHLKEALKRKPNDSSLYYLLGRFKFEIANLSWLEKKMALFTALPPVTLEDALSDFKEAEVLNVTPFKENRLYIAKCYAGLGDYLAAVEWLNSAKGITPLTRDDHLCDDECALLLSKYQKYENNF